MRAERARNNIEGFEAQVQHLEIPATMHVQCLEVFAKAEGGWPIIAEIDQESHSDPSGGAETL